VLNGLSSFVAAQSPSGAEQPAAVYLEEALNDLGLECEHVRLDTRLISDMPLFSCPCSGDHGRYNLLARHLPRVGGGRSVRLEFHYVPKHASWLNMVEIEIGVLKQQCLARRIASRSARRSNARLRFGRHVATRRRHAFSGCSPQIGRAKSSVAYCVGPRNGVYQQDP
jgi:hypothetical protein